MKMKRDDKKVAEAQTALGKQKKIKYGDF